MDKNTLLKDINLDIPPECPKKHIYNYSDGKTIDIVCDRAGIKYIVTPPLVKACEYLYDLNIRTISAGSSRKREIGIWVSYRHLSPANRKIVDDLIQKGIVSISQYPDDPHSAIRACDFRISLYLDFDKETVQSASDKFMDLVKSFGFQWQDVLFGVVTPSYTTSKRIGKKWVDIPLTEEEKQEYLRKHADLMDTDTGKEYMSKELLNKHRVFVARDLHRKHLEELAKASQKDENPLSPQ